MRRTAKVKVAEPGQTLADDVARVNAVRAMVPTVRVDANGGWTVEQAVAAARALTADGPLEYLEQPCRTVAELAEVRRRVDGPGGRRREHPQGRGPAGGGAGRCRRHRGAQGRPAGRDRRRAGRSPPQIDIPVVVSSALDSAVGIAAGLAAAAALPRLSMPAGWAPAGCSSTDVADLTPVDGDLPVGDVVPDPARLAALAAPAERRDWWIARVRECFPLL